VRDIAIDGDPFEQSRCVGRLHETRATLDTFFDDGNSWTNAFWWAATRP
jgi:hypothetical protein